LDLYFPKIDTGNDIIVNMDKSMTMEQSSLVEETYRTASITHTQRLDNTNLNNIEVTDIDNFDVNVDANATNLVDLHQRSLID